MAPDQHSEQLMLSDEEVNLQAYRGADPAHSITTPTIFASSSVAVEFTDTRPAGWHEQLRTIARQMQSVLLAVLGAVASASTPTFFDFERLKPLQRRLGLGLSPESDSFWPPSEW